MINLLNICSPSMYCETVVLNGCDVVEKVTFTENQYWHSPYAYLIGSWEALSITLNSLSF